MLRECSICWRSGSGAIEGGSWGRSWKESGLCCPRVSIGDTQVKRRLESRVSPCSLREWLSACGCMEVGIDGMNDKIYNGGW